MKAILQLLMALGSTLILACNNSNDYSNQQLTKDAELIPIRYNFENLGLYLNASLNEISSKEDWRWDYMTSNNGVPDTIGIDYYMNHSQDLFRFNDETTLPSLSIKTEQNKIIEFSSTVIFHLPNRKKETIASLVRQLELH